VKGWQEAKAKQKIDAAKGLVERTFMAQGSTPSRCPPQPNARPWMLGWQTRQAFFN
jgi:hypothetical protein